MDAVLDVWLKASIEAHAFVGREFWASNLDAMREVYIPGSETYVFEEAGVVKGFFCLQDGTLAAMFVLPEFQGKGIGRQLMDKAKSLREELALTVYSDNLRSIEFYRKCGFRGIVERIDEQTGQKEILMRYPA